MIRLLGNTLPTPCRVFSSDLKIRIDATDLSTFADVTVVCGPVEPASMDPNALTNPAVLVEVTSPSTEDYDRGEKLANYKQLPSLVAVLFVSHRRPQITAVERGEAWSQRELRSGENLVLARPALQIAVDELYSGISL